MCNSLTILESIILKKRKSVGKGSCFSRRYCRTKCTKLNSGKNLWSTVLNHEWKTLPLYWQTCSPASPRTYIQNIQLLKEPVSNPSSWLSSTARWERCKARLYSSFLDKKYTSSRQRTGSLKTIFSGEKRGQTTIRSKSCKCLGNNAKSMAYFPQNC